MITNTKVISHNGISLYIWTTNKRPHIFQQHEHKSSNNILKIVNIAQKISDNLNNGIEYTNFNKFITYIHIYVY